MTHAPRPLRLLVVDDDTLFTQMLPRLLRRTISRPPLEISSATTPEDALALLGQRGFDVVLCDFDLRTPQTGVHVLQHAAKLNTPPFRVLMSGHASRDIPAGAETYDAFLEKPMTLRELPPTLTALLQERMGIRFAASTSK